MTYSSRFFLWAPLGVFLLLLGVAGLHWWIAAGRLGDWLDAHNGREIMPGVHFSFTARRITGFPFSLDTQLQDVTLAAPRERWKAEKFAMHALTYGRSETIFEAAGHQSLQWVRDDGTERSLPFAVGSLRASAIVDSGSLARFDFDVIGFGSKDFTAQRLQFHVRKNAADAVQFLVLISGPRSADRPCPVLSGNLSSITASGGLSHVPVLLLQARSDWTSAARDWRNRSGTISSLQVSLLPQDKPRFANAIRERLSRTPAETVTSVPALTTVVCGR